MSESVHTPGPWRQARWDRTLILGGREPLPIATAIERARGPLDDRPEAEARANAALMAAAPDYALLLRGLFLGVVMIESAPTATAAGEPVRTAELHCRGLTFPCALDERGVPALSEQARHHIQAAVRAAELKETRCA